AVHMAVTSKRNQLHGALLSRFEAYGCACSDVQAKTPCLSPIECQRSVSFEEVVVGAHLYRAVSLVDDIDDAGGASCVQRYVAVFDQYFTWNHGFDVLFYSSLSKYRFLCCRRSAGGEQNQAIQCDARPRDAGHPYRVMLELESGQQA